MTLSLGVLATERMFGVNSLRGPKMRISALFEGHFQRGEKEEEFPTERTGYLAVYLQFTTVGVFSVPSALLKSERQELSS